MENLKYVLKSLRFRSWTKNLFVLAGFVFGRIWSPSAVLTGFAGAMGFGLIAGSVYLINDVVDRRADRLHPEKRNRPIPSGKLSVATAISVAFLLAAVTLTVSAVLAPSYAITCGAYLLMQILYTTRLKHVVILDSLIIAIGFVLRALAGVELAMDTGYDVSISPWLIICTFFLALFLAFAKRRWEVVCLGDDAVGHRRILREYSTELLDRMMSVTTAACVIGYSIYTVSARTASEVSDRLWMTIPFVVFGIFRYLYLIHMKGQGGSPDRILLRDRPLLLNILLWLASVVVILQVFPARG